jgi:hypothetical protein
MAYTKVANQVTSYIKQGDQTSSYTLVDNLTYLSGENLDFLISEGGAFLMTQDNIETAYSKVSDNPSSYTKEEIGVYITTEDANRIVTEDLDAVVINKGAYWNKVQDV